MTSNRKVALITGITGQDGSYLAEFLIEKGYEVHGLLRRSSSFNTARIEHLYLDEWVRDMKKKRLVNLHWADMTDSSSLIRVIGEVRPTEIYNLAAQSHVKVSFEVPEYTADTDANGVLRPHLRPCSKLPHLSGIHVRVVWQGAGSAPVRENPLLSSFAIRRCQTLWLLDYEELSRVLQYVLLQRYFIQPRE